MTVVILKRADALRASIDGLERDIASKKSQLRDAKRELAKEVCPLAIGEEIAIPGYGRKPTRGVVNRISAPRFSFAGDWMVTVTILKASGQEGSRQTDVTQQLWERSK